MKCRIHRAFISAKPQPPRRNPVGKTLWAASAVTKKMLGLEFGNRAEVTTRSIGIDGRIELMEY
jgi:hypothetical protein